MLCELGHLSKRKYSYSEAESQYKQALNILKVNFGNQHPDVASTYNYLALLKFEEKKYQEAENLWSIAIQTSGTQQEPQPLIVATFQDHLAKLYQEQGKFSQAESAFRRALQIRKQIIVGCQESIADTYLKMAAFYLSLYKLVDAENYYNSALESAQKVCGIQSLSAIKCQEGLANVYFKQGRLKEAERLLERILASLENNYNNDDQSSKIACLALLGQLHAYQNNSQKAHHKYFQAIKLIETTLGQDSLALAPVLYLRAQLETTDKNSDLALTTLNRIVELLTKSNNADYALLAKVLCDLSLIYRNKGDSSKANNLLQEGLLLANTKLANNWQDQIAVLSKSADYYQLIASPAEAFNQYKQALKLAENAFGTTHFITAKTLCKLASFYANTGEQSKAIELYMRALPIMESTIGSMQPDLATTLVNLADIYVSQTNYQQAKPLLKRAFAILEQALGPEHIKTIETRLSSNNLGMG